MHWTLLACARVVSLGRDLLTVECSADAGALVNNPKSLASLKQRARELGAGDITVKFLPLEMPETPAERPPAPTPASRPRPEPKPREPATKAAKPQPVQLNKDEFLKDPLIREAIDVFRAQLIEVRAPSDCTP